MRLDFAVGVPIVEYLTINDFDLAEAYREQGLTVIATMQRQEPITAPLVLRDCVGLVKQVLCIRGPAFTPFGLYKQLVKEG